LREGGSGTQQGKRGNRAEKLGFANLHCSTSDEVKPGAEASERPATPDWAGG
jgi:hypothetical protein